MKKCVCSLVAVWFVASGAAAMGQDVLVWATGNSGGATQGVADYLMASGHFGSVTAKDQDATIPLNELLTYDAVLYFSNSSDNQDPDGIGNVLADYADEGRCLVICVFAWADQGGNTLGGRIINEQISPFVLEGGSLYTNVTMADNDGSIFFENVNTLAGFYHDNVRLTPDAVKHGTWSDGEPLVASKANVVGVNLFPDDSWGQIGGDFKPLFANALRGCGAGTRCQYTVTKSKAVRCDTCPQRGDNLETQTPCDDESDCRKKVKTTISCPGGEGLCKLKGKSRRCE